jgi:hypothetical protein
MSRTVVVRYKTSPDAAEDNQRRVEQVFAELAENNPDNLRYLTLRLADGVGGVRAVPGGPCRPLR